MGPNTLHRLLKEYPEYPEGFFEKLYLNFFNNVISHNDDSDFSEYY